MRCGSMERFTEQRTFSLIDYVDFFLIYAITQKRGPFMGSKGH